MRLSDISLIAAFCVAQCERDNFWGNPSRGMAAEALIDDPMQRLMQDEEALLGSPARNDPDICKSPQRLGMNGGASRDRTDDLIVANDALSQLSYSPTECGRKMLVRFYQC